MSDGFREQVFHWHYGSSPLILGAIWSDLQKGDLPGASLTEEENSPLGFKRFMMAMFFLWIYPKNAGLFAFRFGESEKSCRGQPLWKWIFKLEALMPKVIFWTTTNPHDTDFPASVDCVDCKIWEKRHHHYFNYDKSYYSQKSNSAGLKYEIVIDTVKSQCLSVVGPNKCATHDVNVFRQKTKGKMKEMPGKMIVADSIYRAGKKANQRDEVGMMAIPSTTDDKALKQFKSRVRARHETFNGRLKFFGFLRHCCEGVDEAKHGAGFKAVCTVVQCQVNLGSPLFAV